MNTEAICYLLRKTSLTRSEIGKLKPSQLNAIIKEVSFQESVDEYRKMYSVASILAAIYNTIPQKSGHKALTAKDFLSGDMPTREGKRPDSNIEILAKQKGIILPSK
uniref:Uncharacterized protein n=1 Tax=viral metagenome TaxID=1070528 RepID=A0A6M3L8X7_9ZZZZ